MTNEEQIKKWKKQLEEYDKQRIVELNEIRSTPSVPISSRNKDADNGNFFGSFLGSLSGATGIADKFITDMRNNTEFQQKAKEMGFDLSTTHTPQENLNMFGADVGRTIKATGAGLSSSLANLGKGTLIGARNLGLASTIGDKYIKEFRDENSEFSKSIADLKSKAKEQGIDTVSLDEYLEKAKDTKTSLENIEDFSENIGLNQAQKDAQQRIVELQNETENEFAKKAIGFMPNLSQQVVTMGASLINPALGGAVATGQAMGSYYDDAKARGMTLEQANDYSQIMGMVEGATEMIGVDKLIKAGKGAKALAKGGLSSAKKELSKEVITSTFGNLLGGAMDNFMQEALTEPIQEGFADWIGGKGNWENIDQRMLEAGINGAISSLIMGGANIGVQSAVGTASKLRNGQTVTQQELNQDLVDTLAEIDKFSPEEKQEFIDKYVTPGIETAQEVTKQGLDQAQNEPKSAVPMQTSENAQQQVQEQEQQVAQQENENVLKENVEPQIQEQEQEIVQEEEKVQENLTSEENSKTKELAKNENIPNDIKNLVNENIDKIQRQETKDKINDWLETYAKLNQNLEESTKQFNEMQKNDDSIFGVVSPAEQLENLKSKIESAIKNEINDLDLIDYYEKNGLTTPFDMETERENLQRYQAIKSKYNSDYAKNLENVNNQISQIDNQIDKLRNDQIDTYWKNEKALRDKGYIEYKVKDGANQMLITEKGKNSKEAQQLIKEIENSIKEYKEKSAQLKNQKDEILNKEIQGVKKTAETPDQKTQENLTFETKNENVQEKVTSEDETDYKALLQPQLDKLNASDKAQISEIIDNLDAQGQLNEEAYNSALETINALQEVSQETTSEATPTNELSVKLKNGKYGKFDSELSDYRNRYDKGQLDYNKDVVNSAMELVPGKKIQGQQKRTKAEWLRIAQHIGQDIANLSDQQVKDTAYATWLDLAPNNKNTLNREGGKYVDFKSQEWNNAIYDAVKQNRTDVEIQEPARQVAPDQAPAQVPQQDVAKERVIEPIRDITNVERPQVPQGNKVRKTYESIINSNQMTQEAKQIARELMGYDTYEPQTNKLTLAVADKNIEQNGVNESLTTLTNKVNNNDKISAVDIAMGERLIQYYSKTGDRAKLQEAIQTTAMAGTEAGRAVQAMAMLNHQTPTGQVTWIQRSIDKVNKRLAKEGKPQFNFTPEMQQKILNSTQENLQKNLDSVYRELGQQVPKSAMEKFNEWRYFSMLANPKTHIRNILGNVVMGYVQRAKNKVAGTIEDFVIGDNAERWNSLKGASKGMYEFAKNDLKNADVQSMLGLNENKYNPQNRLQQNQRTFKNKFLENTLGKAFDLNSKLLEVEDGWGLKSGYAKAMANYLNANKLDYNNLTDTQLQKARQYAVEQAKATFHQDNSIANMLQTLENKNLATKIAVGGAIPFKKTPMNVALTGFEYSPAGFVKTLTTDLSNLKKGKISANQFIDNISKNLTGTGIAVVGYALTQAGILKASGSGDEDKDEFEEATGKQNYSIQIGDNTYSLDWLTPAGIPLFIGSELYQVSHKQENGNKTKNENESLKAVSNILDATASAMNPMSEMTMISSLTSALKSYASGNTKSIENMIANVGKSYVTQAVPTALGQVARTMDTYERSTTSTETDPMTKAIDSAKNQIVSKIPILRETLPVSTNVWGNERKTQDLVSNAVLPWTKKEISQDPVNKALTDLYDATGEGSVLPDNYIDKTLTIDKEKYKLTNEEYAELKQQYGKTSHDILSNLTNSSNYNKMTDEQKVKAVKEAYSYAKSTLKVKYSQDNDLDAEESATYKKVQSVINNGGNAREYFEYVGLTSGLDKDKDKMKALQNSSIKNKGAIYESTIGKNNETYQIMKNAGINANAYLDYKQQEFKTDKENDYSAKNQFYDYMDDANMTYEQKLLLTGMKYKLNPGERDTLADYIESLPISAQEKTDMFSKLKGCKITSTGEIYY